MVKVERFIKEENNQKLRFRGYKMDIRATGIPQGSASVAQARFLPDFERQIVLNCKTSCLR